MTAGDYSLSLAAKAILGFASTHEGYVSAEGRCLLNRTSSKEPDAPILSFGPYLEYRRNSLFIPDYVSVDAKRTYNAGLVAGCKIPFDNKSSLNFEATVGAGQFKGLPNKDGTIYRDGTAFNARFSTMYEIPLPEDPNIKFQTGVNLVYDYYGQKANRLGVTLGFGFNIGPRKPKKYMKNGFSGDICLNAKPGVVVIDTKSNASVTASDGCHLKNHPGICFNSDMRAEVDGSKIIPLNFPKPEESEKLNGTISPVNTGIKTQAIDPTIAKIINQCEESPEFKNMLREYMIELANDNSENAFLNDKEWIEVKDLIKEAPTTNYTDDKEKVQDKEKNEKILESIKPYFKNQKFRDDLLYKLKSLNPPAEQKEE
jgi:hypothetical protein